MLQHTYNLQQWLRNALSDFCLSKKNPEHLQRSFGQKDWIWELARYEKGYLPEDINAIHWYLYWLHDILWKCTYTGKVIYLISLYEYIYIYVVSLIPTILPQPTVRVRALGRSPQTSRVDGGSLEGVFGMLGGT